MQRSQHFTFDRKGGSKLSSLTRPPRRCSRARLFPAHTAPLPWYSIQARLLLHWIAGLMMAPLPERKRLGHSPCLSGNSRRQRLLAAAPSFATQKAHPHSCSRIACGCDPDACGRLHFHRCTCPKLLPGQNHACRLLSGRVSLLLNSAPRQSGHYHFNSVSRRKDIRLDASGSLTKRASHFARVGRGAPLPRKLMLLPHATAEVHLAALNEAQ